MNKSLLIHSNNTPSVVQKLFSNENIINFNYNQKEYSNIDEYISTVVIKELEDKNFDLIYIKDTLSSNYLELYGLIVVYHIRLSVELKNKRYIPIVILSDIDGFTLNKLSAIAKILFTKNIYLEPNKKESIKKYNQKVSYFLTTKEYKDSFLNVINIDAPEKSSNHDISNKWAIYRWAEFLKINNSKTINKNRKKIDSMLYFKYLKNKYPINEINDFNPIEPTQIGKILYIDDEWKKGWKEIFEYLFESFDFECLEENYKDKEVDEIIRFIKSKIQNYNPDIIILDLRLHSNDFIKNIDIDELTGVKILRIIKEEINRGIQCIALTASQNSLILKKLYKYNIVGYIKKEHPNNYNLNTEDSINELINLVDKGLENGYLKDIWTIQQEIKQQKGFIIRGEESLVDELFINSQFVFDILNGTAKNKMNMAVLTIYKCFEIIVNIYIDKKDKIFKKSGLNLISSDELNPSSCPSTSGTLWYLFNILQKELYIENIDIYEKLRKLHQARNNIIHPKNTDITDFDSKDIIIKWFKILKIIVKAMKDRDC